MTTIDPKLLRLMNEEIDGQITDEGRAELTAGLARDERARDHFSRLVRLSQTLANVEDVCEPEGLAQDVMRHVREVRPPAGRGLRSWLESWRLDPRGALRYGYALAAGILLGVAGMVGLQWTVPFAPSMVSGTIARGLVPGDMSPVQEIRLDLDGLTGHVDLLRAGGSLVVQSRLASDSAEGTIRVVVSFDPALAAFEGVRQSVGALRNLQAGPGRVSWEFAGGHEASLELHTRGRGPEEVRLEFYSGQVLIHEVTLRPDGSA